MKELTIIILNFNTKDLTIDCLSSIFKQKWTIDMRVVVVDNASTDGSVAEIRKRFLKVSIISSNSNLGFSGGNNLGLKKYLRQSKYFLLLNSDTIIKDSSIESLLNFSKKNNYAISSCKLLSIDGSFQPNAGELPKIFNLFVWLSGLDDILRRLVRIPSYQERNKIYYKKDREVGWVSGTAMLIKSSLIEQIGYLDAKIFMYAEDVDYCWRVKRAGFKVGWTNKTEIIHIGGASSNHAKGSQWLGEYRGLIYLYKKYYGNISSLLLKNLIRIFILVRILAFYIVGKPSYSQTYAKIYKEI